MYIYIYVCHGFICPKSIKELGESVTGKFAITMFHPQLRDEFGKLFIAGRHLLRQGLQSTTQP